MKEIVDFLKKYLKDSGQNGWTVGLSGGVDSAVVFGLCLRTNAPVATAFIDIESSKQDMDDAIEVYESQKFENKERLRVFHLNDTYMNFLTSIGKNNYIDNRATENQNLKSRLRANVLWYIGNQNKYIVAGTGNACEVALGYYTLGGDGLCGVAPIAHLLKTQVYKLAKEMDIPYSVINKKPSAGLYEGQTDEDDMGVKYSQVEEHITGMKFHPKVEKIIKKNAFKSRGPGRLDIDL